MLGHVDGASMICGTGSSLYFRKGDSYSYTGGWGYLIDSCGSGYVLGRYAIQAAVRAHDGRAEPTILCELLEKMFKDEYYSLVTVRPLEEEADK